MSKFEKGRLRARVEKNFGTAKRYQEKISSRLNVQAEDWQRRVGEGLQRIDTVFDQAFAFPQLAPQLQLVTASGAQLTPRDMQQVAYYVATEEGSNTSSKSGGSRRQRRAREARMRRELSPAALRFMQLLMILMLLLAACNTVGQNGPITIEPAPTAQVEAEPSPAPNPPPTEEPEPTEPASEVEDEPIEEETVEPNEDTVEPDDTPEIDGTRIPESEVILAAEEAGVTLTPEAVAQFVSTRESGAARKVMYRLAGSGEETTIEIARSDADGNTTYEVIPTPNATSVSEDPETDGILLVMADTDLVFSINTNTEGDSEVTAEGTPEPVPAPSPAPTEEPEPDPTVEPEPTTEPEPTETPTDPSSEYEPNYEFAEEWLDTLGNYFPCIENEINSCSYQAVVEEVVHYDTYNAPNSNAIPIPGTDWVIEVGISVWSLDSSGNPQNYIVPLALANTQTEQRVMGRYLADPLPLWTTNDLAINVAYQFYQIDGSRSAFEYSGDTLEYAEDGDIDMPRIDPGDKFSVAMPYKNKAVTGGHHPEDVYTTLLPVLDAVYGTNRTALATFIDTGDIDAYIQALGDNALFDSEGRPILINGVGARMIEDVVHNGEVSSD